MLRRSRSGPLERLRPAGYQWKGKAANPEEWRELHYRVEGPIVAQLEGAFMDNWVRTSGEILQGQEHFPPLPPRDPLAAQVFFSATQRMRYNSELSYHLAIASAQRSIRITNPYFLPDRSLGEALSAAARRGVKVEVLMRGNTSINRPSAEPRANGGAPSWRREWRVMNISPP